MIKFYVICIAVLYNAIHTCFRYAFVHLWWLLWDRNDYHLEHNQQQKRDHLLNIDYS